MIYILSGPEGDLVRADDGKLLHPGTEFFEAILNSFKAHEKTVEARLMIDRDAIVRATMAGLEQSAITIYATGEGYVFLKEARDAVKDQDDEFSEFVRRSFPVISRVNFIPG